jgi:hypothetical protein
MSRNKELFYGLIRPNLNLYLLEKGVKRVNLQKLL